MKFITKQNKVCDLGYHDILKLLNGGVSAMGSNVYVYAETLLLSSSIFTLSANEERCVESFLF